MLVSVSKVEMLTLTSLVLNEQLQVLDVIAVCVARISRKGKVGSQSVPVLDYV